MAFLPCRHYTPCEGDIVRLPIVGVLASPLTLQKSIDKISLETLSRRRNLSSWSIQHVIRPVSFQRSNLSIQLFEIQLASPMTSTIAYFPLVSLVILAVDPVPYDDDSTSILETHAECALVTSLIFGLV